MPVVQVKGLSQPIQFPDDMDITDIRDVLRGRFFNDMSQPLEVGSIPNTIEPYTPTLSEKIGSGIGDFLSNTGIISDNYGAQRIGKNISTLAEFLPGIGDSVALDDAGRAFAKGNYGEAAFNAATAIPVLGDMAIFAGVLAKNADLGMLRKARELELGGKNRDEVWKETGWFNDKGDWKFEIDDTDRFFTPTQKAYPKDIEIKEKNLNRLIADQKAFIDKNRSKFVDPNTPDYEKADLTIRLKAFSNDRLNAKMDLDRTIKEGSPNLLVGDALSAEVTDNAYPELMDNRFIYQDMPIEFGGSYGGDKSIEINRGRTLLEQESTMFHETQHAVQDIESFAKGGNVGQFETDASQALRNEFLQTWKDARLYKKFSDYDSKTADEKFKLIKGVEATAQIKANSSLSINEIDEIQRSYKLDPYEQYRRLAGEAEARNVQKRLNMTADERRAKPPWETLDVPEDELIYRKGVGVNQSALPMDKASNSLNSINKEVLNDAVVGYNIPLSASNIKDINNADSLASGQYADLLEKTIDGDDLIAKYISGRKDISEVSRTISRTELIGLGKEKGVSFEEATKTSMRGSVGTITNPKSSAPIIRFDKKLPIQKQDIVKAHEIGHLIDEQSNNLDLKGIKSEIESLYNELNNPFYRKGQPRKKFILPTYDANFELSAEAIRLYLTNPQHIKDNYPSVAKRIRQAVNNNPKLNKTIQFNSAIIGAVLMGKLVNNDENPTNL